MQRIGFAVLGLAFIAYAASQTWAQTQAPAGKPAIGSWGFDLAGMDRSVRPGDDFFRYANGAWFDKAVIPSDRASTGSFLDLEIQSEDCVRGILADLETRRNSLTPEEKKVADLYRSFVDTPRVENLGLMPAEKDLNAIAAVKTHDDV